MVSGPSPGRRLTSGTEIVDAITVDP